MNQEQEEAKSLICERIDEILNPPQSKSVEGKPVVPITDYMGESISFQTGLKSNEEIFELVKSLILENKDYYLISHSALSPKISKLVTDDIQDKTIAPSIMSGSSDGCHFELFTMSPDLVDCSVNGVGSPIIPRVIFAIDHDRFYGHYQPQYNMVGAIQQRSKEIQEKFPGHKFLIIKLC